MIAATSLSLRAGRTSSVTKSAITSASLRLPNRREMRPCELGIARHTRQALDDEGIVTGDERMPRRRGLLEHLHYEPVATQRLATIVGETGKEGIDSDDTAL